MPLPPRLDRAWTYTVWGAFVFMCPIWAILWYQEMGPVRFFSMIALLVCAGFFHKLLL